MKDKVQKIREEVARIQLYTQSEVLKQILDYIDKVQEEPAGLDKGKLMGMLEDSLSKETKDSWNERLGKEEPVSKDCPIWLDELDTKLKSMSKKEFQKVMRKYEEECKLQEEPVKIKKGCKYRCLSDMVNRDTGNISFIGDKIYLAPKDNTLVSEENGWLCDTSEDASNFELVEEPVSDDLEEAADNCYYHNHAYTKESFIEGAKWQNKNLWKSADGNDLPEYEREVIALEGIVDPTATDCLCGYKVIFAHRPNPNGWDGKSITTGEVEHYIPKTHGEGGWNIPNIVYWLNVKLPKEIEL